VFVIVFVIGKFIFCKMATKKRNYAKHFKAYLRQRLKKRELITLHYKQGQDKTILLKTRFPLIAIHFNFMQSE
jgi:hypothetical protein